MVHRRALRAVPGVVIAGVSALLVSCAAIFGISEGTANDGGETNDGGGSDADLCATPCETEGVSRCQNEGVEVCTRAGECLGWRATEACAGGDTARLCCAGNDGGAACVAADEANCYACGTACGNPTPRCLPIPKKCGCSVAFCAPGNQGCDPTSGQCGACPAVDPNAETVYVDGATFAGGDNKGTATCPFKTVPEAIDFAKAHASVKTVRVGAGVYDVVGTKALEVRGIALLGAGSATTTLKGIMGFTPEGGTFGGVAGAKASLLLGDIARETRVEGFTLTSGDPLPVTYSANRYGVFCDRGNIDKKDPQPLPAPNTILRDVVFEKGYGVAMEVTTNARATFTESSGCNAQVVGSRFLGGDGHAIQSVGVNSSDLQKGTHSSAIIIGGEAPADAVVISDYTLPAASSSVSGDGTAVYVLDGTLRVLIQNTTIRRVNYGVYFGISKVGATGRTTSFAIKKSELSDVGVQGIGVNCAARLDVLEDTLITNVSQSVFDGGAPAIAVALNGGPIADCTKFPTIGSARRNRIVGNDDGVAAIPRGPSSVDPSFDQGSDFGTASSPGNNVLRCNSHPSRHGSDVRIDVTSGTAVISAHGNVWDHAPPSRGVSRTPDGTDVVVVPGEGARVDVGDAGTAGTEACPANHIP